MLETAFQGEVAEVPAASLAFMGDAVYELRIRDYVLGDGRRKAGELHRLSVQYARASTQALLARALMNTDFLNERERALLLRGRNADPGTMAKHVTPVDYRWATGLETLIGGLYLCRDEERLDALFNWLLKQDLNSAGPAK